MHISITAACARLKPANGAWPASCSVSQMNCGRTSSSRMSTTSTSLWLSAPSSLCSGNWSASHSGQSRRPHRQPAKIRTSSLRLITAQRSRRRLSSVIDGRNGASTRSSPSAHTPIGARCVVPSSLRVVTMDSYISMVFVRASRRRRRRWHCRHRRRRALHCRRCASPRRHRVCRRASRRRACRVSSSCCPSMSLPPP